MNTSQQNTHRRHRRSLASATDAGQPIAEATCPRCEHRHSVVAVALTDAAARCPACGYLYWKIVNEHGRVESFALMQGVLP